MKAYEEIKKLEAALSGDQDLRERYREKVEDLAKQNGTLRLSELAALAAEQIGYNRPERRHGPCIQPQRLARLALTRSDDRRQHRKGAPRG